MVSPLRGRLVIGINATVDLHHPRPVGSTWTHWLRYSGTYFGIGKAAALRVLPSGVHALTYLGDKSRILSDVTAHATPFILECYGQTKCH